MLRIYTHLLIIFFIEIFANDLSVKAKVGEIITSKIIRKYYEIC